MGLRPRPQPRRRADRGGLRHLEPRVPSPRRPRGRLAGNARGRGPRRRPPERGLSRASAGPRARRGRRPLGRRAPRPVAGRPTPARPGLAAPRRAAPAPARRRLARRHHGPAGGGRGPASAATRSRSSSAVPHRTTPTGWASRRRSSLVPLGVPVRLVCGARDPIVPIDQARSYEAAARRAGDTVVVEVVEGAGHFELVDPRSSAWPVVREAVRALLERGAGAP